MKYSIAITLVSIFQFFNWQWAVHDHLKGEQLSLVAFILVSAICLASWIHTFTHHD